MKIMGIDGGKLSAAIKTLEARKTGKYAGQPGVHSVFSGLNAEIKSKGVADIVAFWQAAEAAGIVETRGAKGGAMVYLTGTKPATVPTRKAAGVLD